MTIYRSPMCNNGSLAPYRIEIKPLPLVKQKKNYTCGPAALSCGLSFKGVGDFSEEQLVKLLDTSPQLGTHYKHMARFARECNLSANVKRGLTVQDLRKGLALDYIFIVDYQFSKVGKTWKDTWTKGHYAVVQAVDNRHIWLMDPWKGKIVKLNLRNFEARWHDFNAGYGTAVVIRGKKKQKITKVIDQPVRNCA